MFDRFNKIIITFLLFAVMLMSVNSEIIWDIDINEDDFAQCLPSFRTTVWSNCTNEIQNRTLIDVNICMEDQVEIRKCAEGNDEITNMLLNIKDVSLNRISEDAIYEGYVSGNDYDYVFTPLEDITANAFIVKNQMNYNLYFARLIESNENGNIYLIKPVEDDDLDLLISYGLMINTEAIDPDESNADFTALIVMAAILFFILFILLIVFMMKKHHADKGSDFNQNNKKNKVLDVDKPKSSSIFNNENSNKNKDKGVEELKSELIQEESKNNNSKPLIDNFSAEAENKKNSNDSQNDLNVPGTVGTTKDNNSMNDNKKEEKNVDKKPQSKNNENSSSNNNASDAKVSNLSQRDKDLEVVKNYIKRNSYLPKIKLRENLSKVGWDDDIIDEAFQNS